MENNLDNHENNSKDQSHEHDLSPTRIYQYEDSKQEEEKQEPISGDKDQILNQPIITDETPIVHHDVSDLSENEGDLIREVNPNDAQHNREHNVEEHNVNQNIDEAFYQHNLQNLVSNLNNLRDILQSIVTNNDLSQQLNPNARNENDFNLGAGQLFNNNPQNMPNNQNRINDQLHDLRRIIGGEPPVQNNFFNFPNVNNNPNADIGVNFNAIRDYLKQHIKNIGFYLNILLALGLIILISGISFLPTLNDKSPDFLIDWILKNKSSRLLLIGGTLLFTVWVVRIVEAIYTTLVPEDKNGSFRIFLDSLGKYSPFYDIGFYVLIDNTIIEDKFEFTIFFWILLWQLFSSKTVGIGFEKLNKIMSSITHDTQDEHSKIRKIQLLSSAFLLINIVTAYFVLWLAAYASHKRLIILGLLYTLTIIEPLKVFLSSTILLKNYSLITNNNTKELSDPKFKSELFLDLLYQAVVMSLLLILGFSYSKYINGFIAIYWLSFNNSLQKLSHYWKKFQKWRNLKNKINDLFPLVERFGEDAQERCSICHENLSIARKLPCGHIFHLKCLVYWLENQKTCPNCRANVSNLNELFSNIRQDSIWTRIYNSGRQIARRLFIRT